MVCCHLLDLNHIHFVGFLKFFILFLWLKQFIIYTQTGSLGRALHGRLAHHARRPSPAFEEGEGRPRRREVGMGGGRELLVGGQSSNGVGNRIK